MRGCPVIVAMLAGLTASWPTSSTTEARELAFEERVRAQAAIERVYYGHQIGASKSFEEAVPRVVLEDKVRKYLKQTVALETFWSTHVTGEMLQKEMERQARQTRMPERLNELYAALGNDPLLVRECLARPALVDRLTRNFFAFDERFHAAARAEAEELRRGLLRYGVDAFGTDPRRTDVEIVQAAPRERALAATPEQRETGRIALEAEEFARWRGRAPERPGEIGPLREEREAFVISVVLGEGPGSARIASFTVAKRSRDEWWRERSAALDADLVHVPSWNGALPALPRGAETRCLPDDTWDNGVLDDPPDPRAYPTAVWTGSLMVVWGGHNTAFSLHTGFKTGARYDPATDSWTTTSLAGAPDGRGHHTAVWTGSEMLVWGGNVVDVEHVVYPEQGGRYDPAADSWTPMSTVGAPEGRSDHTAVWTGSEMVVWGGEALHGQVLVSLRTGGRYDPATDTWTATPTAAAPQGRHSQTAVWTGSLMLVWGGQDGSSYLASGGRYDPAADTWTPTASAGAPVARSRHTAVWTGTRMLVWGGYNGSSYLASGGRYDPATDSWVPIQTSGGPSARAGHSAVWTGSVMVVWGGQTTFPIDTGGRYDPATDSWTPTATASVPDGRYNHSAVWTGSLMLVWGGLDKFSIQGTQFGSYLNTGGRYDPVTNTWTATSTGGAPEARYSHKAIFTGNVMVVWGGRDRDNDYLDTGGSYDVATDSWTATSTLGAPVPRAYHTAVWTGSAMVIWGGFYTSDLNTGGRYDPLTDTWTPTSTAGAPSARHFHSAVWTGDSMVVWGGLSLSSDVNTGGRYDPEGNTWMPMSTAGAPKARNGHRAVWTGSLMLIWGGSNDGFPQNTGGRYDPASDSWNSISGVDAPVARVGHTAVWTGTEMVVWGGSNPAVSNRDQFETGGRYDPLADTWTPTSTLGAPQGRTAHTAVWTGSGMVVWGGLTGYFTAYLDTGGRYDPATDAWTPISTAGAPTGRGIHTAVWTGSRMVVWGGDSGDSPLNSGGQYVPEGDAEAKDIDGDGVTDCAGDCDDRNAEVFPGAAEVCDGLDNDCDGVAAEFDADGDGFFACGADCNDADAGAHAAPDEITGQLFLDPVTLAWESAAPSAGSATVHDVVVGSISELPVGSGALETCLASGIAESSTTDEATPASGDGYWYLVRGRNSCDVGSYGTDSAGSPRTSGACP